MGILVETWVDLQTFVALLLVFLDHFVLILPHLLLLLILSLILGFLFTLHFILHLYLVLPLLYLLLLGLVVLLLLILLGAVVGVRAVRRVGGTAMIGVHHLPLVHPLMGAMVGAGDMARVGRQEGTLFL